MWDSEGTSLACDTAVERKATRRVAVREVAYVPKFSRPPVTTKMTSKAAMSRVQVLVGEWRITGQGDEENEYWTDTLEWTYKIEKIKYTLEFSAKKGTLFKTGKLSYNTKTKKYRLDAVRSDDTKVAYEGSVKDIELTLDEVISKEAKRQERIIFTLLRNNRHLGAVEQRKVGTKSWSPSTTWQGTKEGVPFIKSKGRLCVVTGGTGTSQVTYKKKTYYLCCSGCRKSFNENPAKFIAAAKKEGWIK